MCHKQLEVRWKIYDTFHEYCIRASMLTLEINRLCRETIKEII